MAKKKISYADWPEDSLFVSIFCTGAAVVGGQPSHVEEPWRIATYEWDPDHGWWTERVNIYVTNDRRVLTLNTAPTRATLAGNTRVSETDWVANPKVLDDVRGRFQLRCRTCPEALARKAEDLYPALSRLLSIRSGEYSLRALRATVESA